MIALARKCTHFNNYNFFSLYGDKGERDDGCISKGFPVNSFLWGEVVDSKKLAQAFALDAAVLKMAFVCGVIVYLRRRLSYCLSQEAFLKPEV